MSDLSAAIGEVRVQRLVEVPLRDGTILRGTLYLRGTDPAPAPALFVLTPYIAQTFDDYGLYFAARGYPVLIVDCRGRGDSDGDFVPFGGHGEDGYDIVEWLARQPYCDGQVTSWGGSYGGAVQWTAAAAGAPHLKAIAPAASGFFGGDVPFQYNITTPYWLQWLTLVGGRTAQDKMFWGRQRLWGERYARLRESGIPLRQADVFLGTPSPVWQEWLDHPEPDAFWDERSPSPEQYARIEIPVLTITGHYDDDQVGALMYYREHLRFASPEAAARHLLVIGPWDHAGTRAPQAEFGGMSFGPESLVDLRDLHCQWFAWTMQGGPRPEFLRKNVAYYVMGAERWRYADTLEDVTVGTRQLHLASDGNPTDVFASGSLVDAPIASGPDHYVHDPRDVSLARLEATIPDDDKRDQRMLHAKRGRVLVYHSAPFEEDVELSGFVTASLFLGIDQPDTDIRISVHEIGLDGASTQLTFAIVRARYREGLRRPRLLDTDEPLRYDVEHFSFFSRRVAAGHRIRLIVEPLDSIYLQKNHNSGGAVADESVDDSRTVTVRVFHDEDHPSVVRLPLGRTDD